MKRPVCFCLAVVMCLALLAACGDEPANTNSDNPASSEHSGTASVVRTFDASLEHKIIISDIRLYGIVVLDMDICETWDDLTRKESVVWEWDPEEVPSCKHKEYINAGIDEAKFRYSEYYDCDVVIACSSSGWAGVINYGSKEVLWEDVTGNNPHSIEMLPNGDVIVACAGSDGLYEGNIIYYPLSSGAVSASDKLAYESAHGVCWDPDSDLLWVLGYSGVIGVRVSGGGTQNAKLAKVDGVGAEFAKDAMGKYTDSFGHDLSPMYGTPGKYWVTASESVWLFDAQKGTLSKKYPFSATRSAADMKGLAYFADNTMVQTVAMGESEETESDFATVCLRVLTVNAAAGKDPKSSLTRVKFTDREFYKVHTFTKEYQ